MSDRDVQREIEANERRARDEQDVGMEEDVLQDKESDGSFVDNLAGGLLNPDDGSEQRKAEYRDSDDQNRLKPE